MRLVAPSEGVISLLQWPLPTQRTTQ